MKFSIKKQAYLLIFLNFLFIYFLFSWFSDIRILRDKKGIEVENFRIDKLIIIDHEKKSQIMLLKNSSRGWLYSNDEVECSANEFAVEDLLYNLSSILAKESISTEISPYNLLWTINMTAYTGNQTKIDIFENCIRVITRDNVRFFQNPSFDNILSKNFKNFIDEKLWEGDINELRFIKVQVANSILTFVKKDDEWYLELPFSRAGKFTIVCDILKILHTIHCTSVLNNKKFSSPNFIISCDSAEFQTELEFFQQNEEYFIRKNDTIFGVQPPFSNVLDIFYKSLLNMSIFSDIHIDSLEIQETKKEYSLLLQKLETGDKWQVSSHADKSLKFLEISDENILKFEKFLKNFCVQKQLCYKLPNMELKYNVHIQSNVGLLDFEILEDSQQYFLRHKESTYMFEMPQAFIDALRDLINICK